MGSLSVHLRARYPSHRGHVPCVVPGTDKSGQECVHCYLASSSYIILFPRSADRAPVGSAGRAPVDPAVRALVGPAGRAPVGPAVLAPVGSAVCPCSCRFFPVRIGSGASLGVQWSGFGGLGFQWSGHVWRRFGGTDDVAKRLIG
jgi:hypothetical protein